MLAYNQVKGVLQTELSPTTWYQQYQSLLLGRWVSSSAADAEARHLPHRQRGLAIVVQLQPRTGTAPGACQRVLKFVDLHLSNVETNRATVIYLEITFWAVWS